MSRLEGFAAPHASTLFPRAATDDARGRKRHS